MTTTDLNSARRLPPYLKIETLGKGSELTVLERQGKWWRVKSAASGAEGWINGTFVKPKT
ncbi:SH3 domain-containing protein [Rhizobium sullae]|uniref:SH3 domain-containing protein n=1 Tax=Rhizobium sullae TaxID=50338 RepID=UPI0015C68B7D